ncbi:MAG: UDP-N-acetylmuramoyl-tripeptide--D-alanyl-D-alanine ligase [Caulobacteraceae bacterium]|jgi:UDP-N-acetylmuramoyl-tripeptide--D-alanyl-D-alanine ligase
MSEPLWTSAEIAAAARGRLDGAAFSAAGVEIDSRLVKQGDLFVALKGVRDGHDFVPAAMNAGAAGVLASEPVLPPAVIVADTLVALGDLGAAARDRAPQARRGAVTGSVGKTSVTQAVLAGLQLAGDAHGSVKSFNNHIGVPLTLARMPRTTKRAVFEMGMNHAGEIAPLSRLVRPHAVAVTNVEAVHVENFVDGAAGVARAKAEILEGLEPGGAAILNADNPWTGELARAAEARGGKVRTFGIAAGADARLLDFAVTPGGARVKSLIAGAPLDYTLRQTAPHWGPMSLCALLMLDALGVELNLGARALATFEPLAGRGAALSLQGSKGAFTLIDESYNASPVSVTAAVAALGARPTDGRRIAALTDMLELGADAAARHAALAEPIAAAGLDLVFCAGPLMRSLWDALPSARRGAWAQSAAELAPALGEAVSAGDIVMVKGSNASGARLLVETLVSESAAAR